MNKKILLIIVTAFFMSLSLTAQQANQAVITKKKAATSKTAVNIGYSAQTADAASLKAKINYTPVVTDASGLSCSAQLSLVSPNICYGKGTGINICASGGCTYSYVITTSPPGGMGSNALTGTYCDVTGCTGSLAINPSVTTTYNITVTNGPGCAATASVVLNVAPKFSSAAITASPSATLCGGASGTLTDNTIVSTGTLKYNWSNAGEPTKSITVNPSGVGCTTYTVTVTNDLGGGFTCDTVKSIVVCHSNPTVSITTSPGPLLCPTATATLTADTSGGKGTATIDWEIDGITHPTNHKDTISFRGSTTAAMVVYKVTVKDALGCTASASQTITVDNSADPVDGFIDAKPSATICPGQTLTLTWVPNPNPDPTHTYTFNWDNGFGTTSPTYDGTPNPKTFCVTVTNQKGCSAVYCITVGESGTLLFDWKDTSVCKGSSVLLKTGYKGIAEGGGDTIRWSANPPPSGTPANDFGTPAVSPTITTIYCVTVTSSTGCTGSSCIVVKVNDPPTTKVPPSPYGYVCPGVCKMLDADAYVTYNSGTDSLYAWSPAASLNDPTLAKPTACPSVATDYYCTVTDTKGCKAVVGPFHIDIKDVSVSISAPSEICPGDSVILVANPTVTPTASSAGSQTYVWTYDGAAVSSPTSANGTLVHRPTPTATHTYCVTVTDGNCTASNCTTVSFRATPTFAVFNAEACYDSTACITITNVSGVVSATWSPSTYLSDINDITPCFKPTSAPTTAKVTHNYTAIVTDANGCTATASASITVNQLPTVTPPTDTFKLCPGAGCVSISVPTPTGGNGTYSYKWFPSTGLSSDTVQSPCASPASSTTYSVEITDEEGCKGSATGIVVTVFKFEPNIQVSDDDICLGTTVTTTLTEDFTPSTPTPSFSYHWESTPTSTITDTTDASPSFTPTIAGSHTYTVTITEAGSGCTASKSVTIKVNPPPTVTFPSPSVTYCVGENNHPFAPDINPPSGVLTATWTANPCTMPAADVNVINPLVPAAVANLGTCTYTIVVTDNNGCTGSGSLVVTIVELPVAKAGKDTSICSGQTIALGGSHVGTAFNWTSNPPTTITTPTSANPTTSPTITTTYTVTVSNTSGCTATDDIVVTVNDPPAITNGTITVCYNGSVNLGNVVTITGTVSPSYNWTGPGFTSVASNPTVSNLTVTGDYLVTVTNKGGCDSTGLAHVIVLSPLSATVTYTKTACGGHTGSAQVFPRGGTGNYDIAWSGGGPFATPIFDKYTNLEKGRIYVTVTDIGVNPSCDTIVYFDMDELAPHTGDTTGVINVDCFGDTSGSTSIIINVSPTPTSVVTYTYNWSNGPSGTTTTIGAATATNSGLKAGTYTVTVSDGSCDIVIVVVIGEPATPVSVSFTSNNPNCFGEHNGNARAIGQGGTPFSFSPGYKFKWSTNDTTDLITGLGSGTYTVTVTDANGCGTTGSVILTDPTAVVASTLTTGFNNVTCNGKCDGQFTVHVTGGTISPDYYVDVVGTTTTFTYSTSGPGPDFVISSLCPDTFIVTVTDGKGCTDTTSAIITQPGVLSATTTFTPPSTCGASDGCVSITVSGGTPTPTITWHQNSCSGAIVGTGTTVCSLPAGNYAAEVVDGNACTACYQQAISNSTAPTVAGTHTNCTTPTLCNGTIDITITGSPSFSITWKDGMGNIIATTEDLDSLCPGTYCVHIVDINNCSKDTCITITAPAALNINCTSTVIKCLGDSATLDPQASGGNGPITYTWNTGDTTATIKGTVANSPYSVTVMDGISTLTCSFTLTEPTLLAVLISQSKSLNCFGDKADLTATPTGGTPFFRYVWSPGGQTTQTITNQSADTFCVTVTDKNLCTATACYILIEPPELTVTPNLPLTHPTCAHPTPNNCVTITGGTPPYKPLWTPSGDTTVCVSLGQGTWTVAVTDSKGCKASTTISLTQATHFSLVAGTSADVTCSGGSDGIVTATLNGSTPTYSCVWHKDSIDGPVLQTDSNISTTPFVSTLNGRGAGIYVIVCTDATGCTGSDEVIIGPGSDVNGGAATYTQPSCAGACDGSITIINTSGGIKPYTYRWSTGATTNVPTLAGLCVSGNPYYCTVTDSLGCSSNNSIVGPINITEPLGIATVITILQNEECKGECIGSAVVTVANGTGTPGFTYLWCNGQTTDTVTALCAGWCRVTITDANNCTTIDSVLITEPSSPVTVTLAVNQHELCKDDCKGQITATPSGGTNGGWTYNWTANGTFIGNSPTISNLCFANNPYSVTVTDATGKCTASASISITQPTAVTASVAVVNHASCNTACDGTASVTPSGGTPNYTVVWGTTPQQIGLVANNLCAGTYKITITDANADGNPSACWFVDSVTITEPPIIQVFPTTATPTICIGQTAVLDATPTTGGSPGSSDTAWVWDCDNPGGTVNGQKTQKINVNPSQQGTYVYTVTVTDNSATGTCRGTGQVTLVVRPPLNVTAVASPTILCASDSVHLSVTSHTGGDTTHHNVAWTHNSPSPVIITYTPSGTGFSVDAFISNVTTPSTIIIFTATLSDSCTVPNALATITVLVNPTPNVTPSLSANVACDILQNVLISPGAGSITNNSDDTKYYYYLSHQPTAGTNGDGWQDANQGKNFLVPSPSQDFVYRKGDPGTSVYTVKIKAVTPGATAAGCSFESASAEIKIHQSPIVEIEIDPDYKEVFDVNPTTRVTLKHLDDYTDNYDVVTWHFNDPRPSAPQTETGNTTVTHSYPEAGTYKIDLVVEKNGCTGNASIDILVKLKTSIWIPDAFSPNGDGLNDIFKPQGRNIGAVEMYIYNRWGELMFSSNSMNKGWDGNSVAGGEAAQDVYIYKIIITDINTIKYEPFVGRITLVR